MNVPQQTIVAVEFWQLAGGLCGIVVAFATMIWTFSKVLLSQLERRFKARDAQIDQLVKSRDDKIDKHEQKIEDVERQISTLRAELPVVYVQREDWIRFSVSIDTKLDRLRDRLEATRMLVADTHAMRGKNDGR